MTTRWTKRLQLGIPEIDREHEELFAALDRLERAMHDGKGRAQVESMLAFLGDYARTHFAHEEEVMASTGFPGLPEHRRQHVEFMRDFAQLERECFASGVSWVHAVELQSRIYNWLLGHINVSDRAMCEWAIARRGGAREDAGQGGGIAGGQTSFDPASAADRDRAVDSPLRRLGT